MRAAACESTSKVGISSRGAIVGSTRNADGVDHRYYHAGYACFASYFHDEQHAGHTGFGFLDNFRGSRKCAQPRGSHHSRSPKTRLLKLVAHRPSFDALYTLLANGSFPVDASPLAYLSRAALAHSTDQLMSACAFAHQRPEAHPRKALSTFTACLVYTPRIAFLPSPLEKTAFNNNKQINSEG